MHFIRKSLPICFLFLGILTARSDITSVSLIQASQDFGNNDSYPARDNIWSVSAPPYPLNTELGIGHLLNISPSILATDINLPTRLGVLHSHKYDAPFVPVSSAVVTFTFDLPTAVDRLEVLQHFNGITRVEGFAGNVLGSLVSIGNVFGPDGDVRGAAHFFEGQSYVFNFNNTLAGTIFQFRITQTSLEDGYGLHRAFPLLADGTRIQVIPEPATSVLIAGAIVTFVFRRRKIT